MSDWLTDNPPKSGYYIVTWKNPLNDDSRLVSVMWFNGRRGEWWLLQHDPSQMDDAGKPQPYATKRRIIAWRSLPDAPVEAMINPDQQ